MGAVGKTFLSGAVGALKTAGKAESFRYLFCRFAEFLPYKSKLFLRKPGRRRRGADGGDGLSAIITKRSREAAHSGLALFIVLGVPLLPRLRDFDGKSILRPNRILRVAGKASNADEFVEFLFIEIQEEALTHAGVMERRDFAYPLQGLKQMIGAVDDVDVDDVEILFDRERRGFLEFPRQILEERAYNVSNLYLAGNEIADPAELHGEKILERIVILVGVTVIHESVEKAKRRARGLRDLCRDVLEPHRPALGGHDFDDL